ncbi:MAG: hypothetical protein NC548_15000 [Lachnospiraceae bacterium]|nr:hypothetical protein [Lachnospiraceae bacterium]
MTDCVAKEFHVVLVTYDGFNPSEPEKEFTSVMDEEKQIAEYVLKNMVEKSMCCMGYPMAAAYSMKCCGISGLR